MITSKELSHTEQLNLIREAYDHLPDMRDGFRGVKELLLDMNEKSERHHRKGTPGGYPGISITLAAKYFVVKYLLEGWRKPNCYTVDDIINIRNEVLYAQAYAKRFRTELSAWVQQYEWDLDDLDYAKLVK